MSCLNRLFRAGLALVLTAPPASARGAEVLRVIQETSPAGKAAITSTAEAELNAVEKDGLEESPLAGKETPVTEGKSKPEEDAADRLAALELDEKEIDDEVDEDLTGKKEFSEADTEAELDSQREAADEAETVEAD